MLSSTGEAGSEEPLWRTAGPEQNCGFERTPAATLGGIFPSADRPDAVVTPNLVPVSRPLASHMPKGLVLCCSDLQH